MFPKGSLQYSFLLFLKGMLMGIANKVPGVSGGAVAYVLNFYNELIFSFQKLNRQAFTLLIRGDFKQFFHYINGQFLLYVMGGSLFSFFTISKLLDYFLKDYELQVWSLFFGMIIGSGIYLIKKYEDWELKSYISLFTGVLIGITITFIHPGGENDNLLFVLFCGVVGVSGMTIPGLSGSYILMLLGNYVFLLIDSVNALSDVLLSVIVGQTDVLNDVSTQRYLIVISVFSVGSVLGLIFLSQLLTFVLKRWGKVFNAIIIGFIIGSLGTVWPWKENIYLQNKDVFLDDKFNHKVVIGFHKYIPDFTTQETWLSLLLIVFGVFLVLSVERFSKTNNNE